MFNLFNKVYSLELVFTDNTCTLHEGVTGIKRYGDTISFNKGGTVHRVNWDHLYAASYKATTNVDQ
jgi:hypothetical protein